MVQNEVLDRIAKQRKNKYQEVLTRRDELNLYLSKGWELKRQLKKGLIFKKEKTHDELLENSVWLLFKRMGFKEMNKDRNFKIQAGPISKQIDVFVCDDNNVFVVECKSQSENGPRFLRKDIHEILNLKKEITQSIRKHYKRKLRVSFLLVTKNIIWNEKDEKLASDNRKNGFYFWKETDFEAYKNLCDQLGEESKFQMYSILFFGKKILELRKIEVPAIYGGKGKKKYYVFIIQPEKLLQVSYVHRREKSNPKEISLTYQRMVSKNRLKKIREFVDKGGFFPNNIIINFTKKAIFEKKAKVGDITYGILKFPKYYGSAWVIDGQHRLYGYSKSEKKRTDTIVVVAFESLKRRDQANLFVEINKEQQTVKSNLLWDLYPDIYYGSGEEEHQILRAISLIVKKLNSDKKSIFYNRIKIPSVSFKSGKITNLTITNVCDAIKDNRLINEEEGLLYKEDYDHTVEFASERIKAYFDVVAKSFPKDWNEGNDGVLCTNIGIRILFITFRQLLRYLDYTGQKDLYKTKDLSKFKDKTRELLEPMMIKLKRMSIKERSDIRKATGKGPLMENAQKLTWEIKEKFGEVFGSEILRKWAPPIPKEATDKDIRSLLGDTEKKLREFIINDLKKLHHVAWWRRGMPDGVKKKVKKNIEDQIRKESWRREELLSLSSERKARGFMDTPCLREIIEHTPNWRHFQNVFIKDKEFTTSQFKSFEFVRNKYQHHVEHECDEIDKNLGYWGMRWIRRCIGLDTVGKEKNN